MKYAILIPLMFMLSCGNEELPRLGQHFELPPGGQHNNYIPIGYHQQVQAIQLRAGGVDYMVGLKYGTDVVYIGTMDPSFATPEGYTLETSYQEIINGTNGRRVQLEYGWGWRLKLPSGWEACFTIDPRHSNQPPDIKRKVEWFCKK